MDAGRLEGAETVAVDGRLPTSAAVDAEDAKEDEDEDGSRSTTCDT